MTEKQIELAVVDSLEEFLRSTNKEVPIINRNTKPIGDLGLDSPDGIDWVCDLEDRGIMIPINVNPFVDDDKKRARNIGEIVNFLFNTCNNSEDR